MLNCKCGGILVVVAIEEPPMHLSKEKRSTYNRVCDVKWLNCGKVNYSQPYDGGSGINTVKKTKGL